MICGRERYGKTTLLRYLLSNSARALAFDPLHILYPGLIVDHDQLEDFFDLRADNQRFRVIYRPQKDEADFQGMLEEAEFFCWIARNFADCDLYFDEIDAIYTAGMKRKEYPELYALLNFGRRHEIGLCGVVRRPQTKMPQDWLSAVHRLTIFNIQHLPDLYMLRSKTGIPTEDMMALEQFEYLEWDEGPITRHKMENPYL